MFREKLQDEPASAAERESPSPVHRPAVFVRGALEAHVHEIVLETPVGFGVGQYLKVDDQVEVARASMHGDVRFTAAHEIGGGQTPDENDGMPPRPKEAH